MHEVAEGLVVQLEEGDVAVMHDSILMVAKSRVCQKHTLNFEVMAKDGPLQLPDKAIALSPIVDLSPDGVVFEEPILVILPVCIGATKAWRSLGDSSKWEVLPEARFHAGYAILYLDHFCKIAAGGDEPLEAAIKISCYMNSLLEAKWAITHAACGSCRNLLRSYANDEDVLQDYKPCKPASYPAGGYAHGQDLRLAWPHVSSLEPEPGQPEPGRLNFRRFPLVPCLNLKIFQESVQDCRKLCISRNVRLSLGYQIRFLPCPGRRPNRLSSCRSSTVARRAGADSATRLQFFA